MSKGDMMAEMMNTPTPGLIYPKSSGLYLMAQVQEKTANIADLIETLNQRDRTIAEMEHAMAGLKVRIAELELPAKGNGAAATA